jgi:hypothetical protein
MRRIHITGGPGAGKTTLARRLGVRLGIDVFELDGQALSHIREQEGPLDLQRLTKTRLAESIEHAAEDSWISEGSNIEVARPFLERAEVIVVVHCRWRVAAYRILARHLKASIARNNRWPSLPGLYRFWRWSGRYYANRNEPGLNAWGTPTTQAWLEAELAPFANKLLHCRTDEDVAALEALLEETL